MFDAFPSETYWVIVGGYYGSAGPYVLSLDAVPCPEVPAVADMVALLDVPNGNMLLNWSPVAGADYYNIYAIPTEPYIPGNPVDIAYGTSYTHFNALNDFNRMFYLVVAVDLPNVPAAPPMATSKPIPPATPAPKQVPPWVTYDYTESLQK